jgi:hypothetical protein
MKITGQQHGASSSVPAGPPQSNTLERKFDAEGDTMNAVSESVAPRSSFVTSLAWTFIVLAGFATAISVLQNVMINLMFPTEEIRGAMREAHGSQAVPPFAAFMFEHFRLLVASFLVVSVLTLVSAIGLLKRMNWARIIFIGLMVLGVVWNLAGIFIPYFMVSSFPPIPDTAPHEFQDNFQLLTKIMIGFTTAIAIVFAVLFAWLAKRLMSADIKREFNAL